MSSDTPASEHGHLANGGRLSLRVRHFIGSDWSCEVDDDGEPMALDEQVPSRDAETERILAQARALDARLADMQVIDADPDDAAET